MKTMILDWSKFSHMFGPTWEPYIKPFFESGEMDKIYAFLKETAGRGKPIAPKSDLVFRCFKETPLDTIKVVLMGLSPYHTLKDKQQVANGLLMSTDTEGLPPSLEQFYTGMEDELFMGMNLLMDKTTDLSYLAHQGVLLFNASLTCEIGKPGSHLKQWEPFTRFILEKVIAPRNIPVVFLGQDAAKFKRSLAPMQWSFTVAHPASASYKGDKWSSEGIFRKVNNLLHGEGKDIVQWAKLHEPDMEDLPF